MEKLTTKRKIKLGLILLIIIFLLVSCSDVELIKNPEQLVCEMTKSQLYEGILVICLIAGIITS